MTLLKSKYGEVKTKAEWENEIASFWRGVKSENEGAVIPKDAFVRYAGVLGLEEVPYKGVF